MKIEAENVVDPIAEHVAAIISKVEAGASVRSCTDQPGGLTRNEFRRAVARDPVLLRRYEAAIAKWTAPHARSRLHFDAIIARIEAGELYEAIFRSGVTDPGFPDGHSFYKFLKASPEHAERYRAAFRRRSVQPRGFASRYTDDEIKTAAEAIAGSDRRYLSAAPATRGPHYSTLMNARTRSLELCAVIERAMVARITRLQIKDGPMFRPMTPGLVLPRRRAVRRVYEKFVLRRALSQNEIYAAVDAAVPRYFAPHDRDDIIGQTVLEVIEDGLGLEMVETVAREIIGERFYQMRVASKTKSLDAPLLADSNITFGDTISNGW